MCAQLVHFMENCPVRRSGPAHLAAVQVCSSSSKEILLAVSSSHSFIWISVLI